MVLPVVLVLLVIGTVIFHFTSPWWFTPLASNWGNLDTTILITMWITGIVFIAVNLFLAYSVYRYRYREGRRAEFNPENTKLEWGLGIFTSVGIVAMLAPGLIAWYDYTTVPDDAWVFEAVGQQWQWTYRFPGSDGILGTAGPRHITVDNPYGLNPEDPYSRDDILVEDSEVHIPIDKPVKVLLRSKDVLHDFYVPQFRAKMDMVPGLITYLWFTPTKMGTYEIICAEFCGNGHSDMRGSVVVGDESEFQAWLSDQPTFADYLAEAG